MAQTWTGAVSGGLMIVFSLGLAGCGSGSGDAEVLAGLMEDCVREVGDRAFCECSIGGIRDRLSGNEFSEWVAFERATRGATTAEEAVERSGMSREQFETLNTRYTTIGMEVGMQCMLETQ